MFKDNTQERGEDQDAGGKTPGRQCQLVSTVDVERIQLIV